MLLSLKRAALLRVPSTGIIQIQMNSMMLHDFSPAALVRAIEENFVESWGNFGRIGGELHQDGGIVRIACAIPQIPYNGVLRTDWRAGTDITAEITANIAYFRERQAQMIWAVTPSTQPPDLAAHLVRHGFSLLYELAGMAADLACLPEPPPLPPGVELREVDDLRSLREYADLVVEKWRLPPENIEHVFAFHRQWGIGPSKSGRRWLVWKNGVPVAKALLSLAAGAAGIYGVSTAPAARRQGIGGAVTAAALRAARQAGCRIGVLHSTGMGKGVYQSLGFKEYCKIGIYVLAQDGPSMAEQACFAVGHAKKLGSVSKIR